MSVINIRTAERAGARTVIGLAGISGSGKTRTALEIAFGLANFDASKVGLLDAENKRGSLYADCLKDASGAVQRFMVGDLEPPFSPKRYKEAILAFQRAGVEVLVIDSMSHEWEGTGGCEEIAHAQNPRMPDWATAKREHKDFMNALLQSDMHIIACLRAREKVKITKTPGKPTQVESIGIQPITEKNVMFELTASLLMWDAGRMQEVVKCPEELAPILGRGKGYISAQDGKALRDWIEGGVKLDPEIEHARNTLRTVAAQGVDAYRAAFEAASPKVRKALAADGTHATLKRSAEDFDAQRKAGQPGGEALDDLNAEVMAG